MVRWRQKQGSEVPEKMGGLSGELLYLLALAFKDQLEGRDVMWGWGSQ